MSKIKNFVKNYRRQKIFQELKTVRIKNTNNKQNEKTKKNDMSSEWLEHKISPYSLKAFFYRSKATSCVHSLYTRLVEDTVIIQYTLLKKKQYYKI